MTKKNILFLMQTNVDIDFNLPLAVGLKESNLFEPLILFIRPKKEIEISKRFEWVIAHYNLTSFSLDDLLSRRSFLTRTLVNISDRCFDSVPTRMLIRSLKLHRLIMKITYIVIRRMLDRYPHWFFVKNEVERFIFRNSITMLILDIQQVKKSAPYRDMRSYIVSKVAGYCKTNGIPVFMIPHGAAPSPEEGAPGKGSPNAKRSKPGFHLGPSDMHYPEMLAANIEVEKPRFADFIDSHTKVVALGVLRYDYAWNKKMEAIPEEDLGIKLKKEGLIVLYLVTPFQVNDSLNEMIHSHVLSLVDIFPQAELWVKNHPRYPWHFNLDDYDIGGSSSRVKVFRNEVDTTALILRSDIVITPSSSALCHAIIDGKPSIFYDFWRTHLNFRGRSAYDETPCVLKATTPEELVECCRRAIDGEKPTQDAIEEFYKSWISESLSPGESIIGRYVDAIKELLGEEAGLQLKIS